MTHYLVGRLVEWDCGPGIFRVESVTACKCCGDWYETVAVNIRTGERVSGEAYEFNTVDDEGVTPNED